MAVALLPDQELATKAFLDALSEAGAVCVSRATAIRFLFARKFDVARAHTLWRHHEETRRREGLIRFEPFEDPLRSELETGKFTILPTRDATGAAIAVFTAHKHFPSLTTHQTTLQILAALAFFATGSYQTLVGQNSSHNLSQPSVSRAVRQVTAALNVIFRNHIKWPIELEERNRIKAKFYRQFHIPGVLGCIDGTFVAIIRPESHEERFFNRKGYHSLNVMIICDSDLQILCVDPSSPGSAHDATVWQSHPLSRHLEELNSNEEQVYLLGDSGYPLRTTMMTPILNTVRGTPEHYFYKLHVRARNSVERCIGLLKARFRCLLAVRALHYNPTTAAKIVNACCVLHNIANRDRTPVMPLTVDEFRAERQHQIQGVVYQLDVALQSVETQRAGLVFIYDMTDSKYTNFDYELSQKILTMLKGAYPAKLKKVLIVTAPLWFKAPFRILRLFVREKLRERVHTVSAPQLGVHVPRASLPKQLGGQLEPDHAAWLEHCRLCYTNNLQNTKLDGVIDEYVISNHIPPVKQNGIIGREAACDMTSDRAARLGDPAPDMHISGDPPYTCDPSPLRHTHGFNGDMKGRHINSGDEDDIDISTRGTWSSGEASPGLSDEECVGGGAGVAPAELLARVRALGRRGLVNEYEEIRARPPVGTFHHAKLPSNLAKNRYTDVLCYDHSRVILSQTDPDDPSTDYINANYVDGYKQKNAFICTQGPLPKTFGDFWRMVWEQGTLVVVMTTRAVERGRVKCGQYWPVGVGARQVHAGFAVATEAVDTEDDYTITHLVLTDLRTEQSRRVWHGQYTRWPDYGVPGGGRAQPVLRFLQLVRRAQQLALADLGDAWAGHSRGPPIVVHCSAGIGRTGTFLTLDICATRLSAEGLLDVRGTVERVRAQRAHSIQMPDQYVFSHLALLEYAVMHGYLESADLSGFDDDNEDESE